MNGICYLAAPIDHAIERPEVGKQRRFAQKCLAKQGWVVYDPLSAFTVNGSPRGAVQEINTQAVIGADAVLALLPEDVLTYGVAMEIQAALMARKIVAVVGGANVERSWSLAHVPQFDDVADAVQFLGEEFAKRRPQEAIFGCSPLKFARVGEGAGALLPTRAYADDAGFDLYTTERVAIKAGGFKDVPTGVAVELPNRYWAMIVGRSSTLRKRGLLVSQGIIDTGYRGELFAGVQNLGTETAFIEAGDRIAQLIVLHNASSMFVPTAIEATELSKSARGGNGFGSSGS